MHENIRKIRKVVDKNTFETIERLYKTKNINELSELTNLSKDCTRKTIVKIEDNSANCSYRDIYMKKGRKEKDNVVTENELRSIINDDNSLTLIGIQKKFCEIDTNISISTISRLIKKNQKTGFSRQY
ncbi:hypothetical protein A3Q56_05111 [Intoshia linei]|uniref:Transposase Tc1-like domain-containing protein n=1 Tax=Intoshia linei TaxID=1819745 RepID=A0A177AYU9_9BILA|nr:hypothetical protein A3Q56_05111 [Intoshia linei]